MSKRRQYRRRREASNEDREACDDEKSTEGDDTVRCENKLAFPDYSSVIECEPTVRR